MHELSIANNLVELATDFAKQAGAERVESVKLRIGALSCVHTSALQFSFEMVTEGTMLEGATLEIVRVPVVVFCSTCNREVELPDIQRFRCPECGTPSGDIRQGKELDIESIQIESTQEHNNPLETP